MCLNSELKTALITGASSGIGAEIARLFACQGITVYLVARREDRLNQIAQEIRSGGGSAEIRVCDLNNADQRANLIAWVETETGGVDILVNNAGFGWYGFFDKMPWDLTHQLIEVNLTAVVHLTYLVLPGMKHNKKGHIINIGSISAGIPSQGIAMYAGSKSFLDAFTSSLHRELQGSGVHVSVLRPGPVKTEFFDVSESQTGGHRIPAEQFAVEPHAVAEAALRLLKHPARYVYIPWYLGIIPWIELVFGGVMDRIGPLLLRMKNKRGQTPGRMVDRV